MELVIKPGARYAETAFDGQVVGAAENDRWPLRSAFAGIANTPESVVADGEAVIHIELGLGPVGVIGRAIEDFDRALGRREVNGIEPPCCRCAGPLIGRCIDVPIDLQLLVDVVLLDVREQIS